MENERKYQPYHKFELDTLLHEPWEISDQPFKLHAAYALSSLYDVCVETESYDESDGKPDPECIWGMKIGKKFLDRLVRDVACDFNDAADNYKPVTIWGRNYAIRKANSYDHKRLGLIFNFPLENGDYTIAMDGVMNLSGVTPGILKPYEITREQAKRNRTYLRQIIMLGEDDETNGWDRLTDMEVAVYCWAQFYNKYQSDNFVQFQKEYRDYMYVSQKDMESCFNAQASLRLNPNGMYTFSCEKVMEWNAVHGQESEAARIPANDADDYWYNTALKGTFQPIDLREKG